MSQYRRGRSLGVAGRRQFLAAAGASFSALMLSGCGGSEASEVPSGTASQPPVPAPVPAPTPAPPPALPTSASTAPVTMPPVAPAPTPIAGLTVLPGWVPTTVGAAGFVPMTNTLDDVVSKGVWSGDSAASFCAYSGGCFNPYLGPLGAHVIHGGGHAASNDNSVIIANLNTLAFERVGGPTRLDTDAAYDDAIRYGSGYPNDISNPREVADGEPGSAHTYDCLLTLPPSICGDPLGALIRPVASAIGRVASRDTGWSHAFMFSERRWRRWSNNHARSWTPGGSCVYDTSRGYIWAISDANMTYRPVLGLANRSWTNIPDHRGLASYPDMVYSAYCAHRDVVVIATNSDGETSSRFYWFGGATTGAARTPVAFANGPLPNASWGRGTLVYVAELRKLIFWSQYNPDTYYEIDVPVDAAGSWSWVARAITGPARPSALSPAPYGSTYKRMDYAPQLKSLVWVTGQKAADTYRFGGRVVAIRVVA